MVDIYKESISGPGITPPHRSGAIVPMFLADQSAMNNFGKVLSFQGNKGIIHRCGPFLQTDFQGGMCSLQFVMKGCIPGNGNCFIHSLVIGFIQVETIVPSLYLEAGNAVDVCLYLCFVYDHRGTDQLLARIMVCCQDLSKEKGLFLFQ